MNLLFFSAFSTERKGRVVVECIGGWVTKVKTLEGIKYLKNLLLLTISVGK